jgi:hypothetical protein
VSSSGWAAMISLWPDAGPAREDPFAFQMDDRTLQVKPAGKLGTLISHEWRAQANRRHGHGRYPMWSQQAPAFPVREKGMAPCTS